MRGFNPHPSRRTGATGRGVWKLRLLKFQSSPVPKDGCNRLGALPGWAWTQVSILTRPEGRVQLANTACSGILSSWRFQSSPVPKDGCNRRYREWAANDPVSILTRPEGRVQRPEVIAGVI